MMSAPAPEWIVCGQAEKLVKAITGEGPDDFEAFRALLKLASIGHVRVSADSAEAGLWRPATQEILTVDLDFSEPWEHPETRWFLQQLIHRYQSSDRNLLGFSCFLTGTFEFGEVHHGDAGEERYSFEVLGLKFDRKDIINRFGPSEEQKRPVPSARRLGRTPGSGSLADLDQPFIEEMRRMIACGEALSADGAAGILAHRAPGAGTEDSKKARLARRYRDQIRPS